MGFKVRLPGSGPAGRGILFGAAASFVLFGSVPASAQATDGLFLTVHGPNDGEPLNNSIEIEARSNVKEAGYVLVYHRSNLVYMASMAPGQGEEVSSATISIDTTRFPNGPVTFHFFLYTEPLDVVLARTVWTGTIWNPAIEPGEERTERITVTLLGMAGDFGYTVLAGKDRDSLLRSPMEDSEGVQWVATGFFSNPGWKDSPSAKLVLNLDDLVRLHTTKGSIVLWTLNIKGQWSRSKVLPLRHLLSVPNPYGDRMEIYNPTAYRP